MFEVQIGPCPKLPLIFSAVQFLASSLARKFWMCKPLAEQVEFTCLRMSVPLSVTKSVQTAYAASGGEAFGRSRIFPIEQNACGAKEVVAGTRLGEVVEGNSTGVEVCCINVVVTVIVTVPFRPLLLWPSSLCFVTTKREPNTTASPKKTTIATHMGRNHFLVV